MAKKYPEKKFTKPYDGWINKPQELTPITAEILNMEDATFLQIEDYLSKNDIPTDLSELTNEGNKYSVLQTFSMGDHQWDLKGKTNLDLSFIEENIDEKAKAFEVGDGLILTDGGEGKADTLTLDLTKAIDITQIQTDGKEIAEININGSTTTLYAPEGGEGGGTGDANAWYGTYQEYLAAEAAGEIEEGTIICIKDDVSYMAGLNTLCDVDFGALVNGQVLMYDESKARWTNANLSVDEDGNVVTEGSNQIDYSTNEQYTGKRWIDGKKVYQKTFTFKGPAASGDTVVGADLSDLNYDMIKIVGGCEITETRTVSYAVPSFISTSDYTACWIKMEANTVTPDKIAFKSTHANSTVTVTIEYTKK